MRTNQQYGPKAEMALGLWVKLARAYSTLNKETAHDIAGYGVTTPQFGVLECLGHLGPLPMGELSRKLLVSGGNTTVVVQNLIRQGYVERSRAKNDRRTIVVKLTPKGMAWFREVFPKHAEFIVRLTSHLDEKEQRILGDLLRKLGCGIESQSHSLT